MDFFDSLGASAREALGWESGGGGGGGGGDDRDAWSQPPRGGGGVGRPRQR
jgi:hypothetical protein